MRDNSNDIKVTICCAVFNHEKYLREALEGFVHQKTNFAFEVLVSDDCSTDDSRKILQEYEEQYPDIMRVLYQEKNQYSQGKKIFFDVLAPLARGKYLAICEGDDRWTNMDKLQLQFDCMERNTDCSLCTHKVRDINGYGIELDNAYPGFDFKEGKYSSEEILNHLFSPMAYLFHTSSFFLKSESIKKFNGVYPDFIRSAGVGDVPLTWLLADEGSVFYIDCEMSQYRRDIEGSWSKKMQKREYRKTTTRKLLKSLNLYDEYTHQKYRDLIDEDITKTEFDMLRLTDDYHAMKAIRYRKYFNQLTKKQKILYFISSQFPNIRNLIDRMR